MKRITTRESSALYRLVEGMVPGTHINADYLLGLYRAARSDRDESLHYVDRIQIVNWLYSASKRFPELLTRLGPGTYSRRDRPDTSVPHVPEWQPTAPPAIDHPTLSATETVKAIRLAYDILCLSPANRDALTALIRELSDGS